MTDTPPIVDIFGDIVAKVSTALTAKLQVFDPHIVGVNYLYGVPLEISKVLTQWSASETFDAKKYPLIALFQPFDEVNNNNNGIAEVANLRIIIARNSVAEWLTPDRYTNNFRPVLYPIYNELLNQISLDKRIFTTDANEINHVKRDWPYWDDGKGTNPFNDRLDVIEILKLNLKINLNYC